jgi:uncharacterized protein (DUF2062 family)
VSVLERYQDQLRGMVRALFPKDASPVAVGMSVFVGAFIGVLPTLGVALPLTAVAVTLLRLPKGPGLAASFIAIPPTLFLFFYPIGYALGRYLYEPPSIGVDFLARVRALSITQPEDITSLAKTAGSHVVAFLIGMAIVAAVTGLVMAVAVGWTLTRRRAAVAAPSRPDAGNHEET